MRAKRPLRTTGPCFNLTGLSDHAAPELQVQQKNEQELNKFFIDVDDTTVSPMITTDPSFRTASTASMSNINSVVDLTSVDNGTRPSRSVEAASKAAPSSAAAPSPAAAVATSEAKFIHVNNTNIFILIDGVSMFVEGRSTFTGTEDARLLTERLRQKKLARSVDTVQEAILNIEMSADGGMREVTAPTAPPTTTAGATITRTSPVTQTAALPQLRRSSLPSIPMPLPLPTSVLVEPKSPWASLFEDAIRPQGSPLFRNFRATALSESLNNRRTTLSETTTAAPSASSRATTASPATAATPTSAISLNTGFNGATRLAHSASSPTMQHHDSCSSLLSLGSGAQHRHMGHTGRGGATRKAKPISVEEIGHSNRSLDMDEVEIEEMIGKGTQGTVFRVRSDGKLYALKCMNIDEAMNATNDVERQGRKKGLVKELTMITLQRERPPPGYLMQMFNAVASLDAEKKELSILMELMSVTVENIQQMISRIPSDELMRVTQSTFRKYMSGDPSTKSMLKDCCMDQRLYGSPRHVVGRNVFNEPAAWEKAVERQTPMPELVLSLLARDVLMGLNELHTDYSIVHCDLKPANVLLCYDQQHFKLADFGCGCCMEDGVRVERRGLDLGTMLYKAPERFTANVMQRMTDLDDFGAGGAGEPVVEFTARSDVWSLGVMLLELAAGIHPCDEFKSDFWNYGNLLRLSKMNKPLNWSEAFYDFILRSVCIDVSLRWSVQQLLKHPFVVKFSHVPREKLRAFVQRLQTESKTFHKRQQSEQLKQQILLSTTRRHRDTYHLQSKKVWSGYTAYLKRGPPTKDERMFPELPKL